jgi:hypothetical protein
VAFPITASAIIYLGPEGDMTSNTYLESIRNEAFACPGIARRYGIKPRKYQEGRFDVRNSIWASPE